jgi:hypothetical protein
MRTKVILSITIWALAALSLGYLGYLYNHGIISGAKFAVIGLTIFIIRGTLITIIGGAIAVDVYKTNKNRFYDTIYGIDEVWQDVIIVGGALLVCAYFYGVHLTSPDEEPAHLLSADIELQQHIERFDMKIAQFEREMNEKLASSEKEIHATLER